MVDSRCTGSQPNDECASDETCEIPFHDSLFSRVMESIDLLNFIITLMIIFVNI